MDPFDLKTFQSVTVFKVSKRLGLGCERTALLSSFPVVCFLLVGSK